MEDNRIPLKIYIGDDVVRRTSLPQAEFGFNELKQILIKMTGSSSWKLSYLDQDQTKIALIDDDDFQEMKRLFNAKAFGSLQFFVESEEAKVQKEKQTEKVDLSKDVEEPTYIKTKRLRFVTENAPKTSTKQSKSPSSEESVASKKQQEGGKEVGRTKRIGLSKHSSPSTPLGKSKQRLPAINLDKEVEELEDIPSDSELEDEDMEIDACPISMHRSSPKTKQTTSSNSNVNSANKSDTIRVKLQWNSKAKFATLCRSVKPLDTLRHIVTGKFPTCVRYTSAAHGLQFFAVIEKSKTQLKNDADVLALAPDSVITVVSPQGPGCDFNFPADKVRWYWMDEYKTWNPYPSAVSSQIEQAYLSGVEEVTVINGIYKVNPFQRKQIRKSTGMCRKIIRGTWFMVSSSSPFVPLEEQVACNLEYAYNQLKGPDDVAAVTDKNFTYKVQLNQTLQFTAHNDGGKPIQRGYS